MEMSRIPTECYRTNLLFNQELSRGMHQEEYKAPRGLEQFLFFHSIPQSSFS